VRSHWALLSTLLESLRKQPNVRLGILFGSVARGDAGEDSDLDLLVHLRHDDHLAHAAATAALEDAVGRRVQLISLEQAEDAPLLLADVLRDGRVLVDRDGRWDALRRRQHTIATAARRDDEHRQRLAWETPDALEEIGRLRLGRR
jgi:predicted nucleotidyltransferase